MIDRLVIVFGLLTLLVSLRLITLAPQKPNAQPPCAHSQPVLCAEFPPNGAALSAWLGDPVNTREDWRRQILWDMPFLVLYGLVFVFGALALAGRDDTPIAIAAVLFAIVGSSLDLVENLHILAALDMQSIPDGHATWIRAAASFKLTALAIASVLVAVLASRNRTRFVGLQWLGAIIAVTATVGFAHTAWWGLGGAGITLALLAVWIRSISR